MTSKAYVFGNVPKSEHSQDSFKQYLEATLRKKVLHLEWHDMIPERVLVTFEDGPLEGIEETNQILKKEPINTEAHLVVSFAAGENTLILDRRQLSLFEIHLGSIRVKGGTCALVDSFSIPHTDQIAAILPSSQAIEKILGDKSMAEQVEVQRFYTNFHGCIPFDGDTSLSQKTEEARLTSKKEEKPFQQTENAKSDGSQSCGEGEKGNEVKDEPAEKRDQRTTMQVKKPTANANEREKPTANANEREKPTAIEPTGKPVKKFMQSPCHSKSIEKLKTEPEFRQKYVKPDEIKQKHVNQDEIRQKDVKQESQLESGSIEFDCDIWSLLKKKIEDLDLSDMEYDVHRQILNFQSLDVEESKNSINDLIADIIHDENPLQIKGDMREILKRSKCVLDSRFNGYLDKYDVHCVLKETCIHLYGWDVDHIESTRKELIHFFQSVSIDNKYGMNVDILKKEKSRLELKFLVSISWLDSEAKTIQINGISDDIPKVTQELHQLMNKYKIVNESFEFTEDHSVYIEKHCRHELTNILKNITVLVNEKRDKKLYIKFSGISDEINDISKDLNQLKSGIKSEYFDVSSAFDVETSSLVIKALKHVDKPYSKEQKIFENDNNCCIVTNTTEDKSKPSKQRKKSLSEEDKMATADLVSFQLTVNSQLTIKHSGDIVEESADVLVCILGKKLKLKGTRVGMAFRKRFPNLQSVVDDLDFSSNNVPLYTHQAKDVNCKPIAFLCLPRYSQDSAEDNFKLLISEVLTKAIESNAKTIAFPPVGLGKALKYPADFIATQFCLAAKEHVAKAKGSNQLAEIIIVANDSQLYYELQKQADTLKSLSPSQHSQKSMSNLGNDSPIKNAKICIMHRNEMTLAPIWKKKISNFEKDEISLQSFGVSLEKKVKEEMSQKVLTLSKHETDTGEWKLEFNGLKSHIQEIKVFITSTIQKQSQHIISEDTPPRRTLYFLKHARGITEKTPPYWKHKTNQAYEGTPFHEVELDKGVSEGIKEMFLKTWDSTKTGKGNDAANIPPNSTVEVVDVKRIENWSKFQSYASMRLKLLEKKYREQEICKSISEVSANKKESLLESYLPSEMKEQLCHEVNEYYLLHGTKTDIVDTIKDHGCDPKVSNQKGMLGRAVYTAECSTKCDQYTDPRDTRLPSGSFHYAFLMRILLGDIFVADKSHEKLATRDCEKFNRPPCKKCFKDTCSCRNNRFYDSIMVEDFLFREFCVYGADDLYPEYIISYKRI